MINLDSIESSIVFEDFPKLLSPFVEAIEFL